jgi:hypothetical protein
VAAAHRGGIDSAAVVEPAGGVLNGRGELAGDDAPLRAKIASAKKINEYNRPNNTVQLGQQVEIVQYCHLVVNNLQDSLLRGY